MMKLYRTQVSPRWHSSKTGLKDFDEVDLPKEGRQGMADFLNANEVEAQFIWDKDKSPEEYDPLHEAEQRAIEQARGIVDAARAGPLKDVSRAWDASDIEDFILNRATVAEVENIFQCLGARFKELANEKSL